MPVLTPSRIAIVVMVLAMGLSPIFMSAEYDLFRHTTSEYGAQATPYAWIMNIGFLAFGLGVAIDSMRRWHDLPLVSVLFVLFGVAMMMTGVFSNKPIIEGLPFHQWEDDLHSVFSGIVGASFIAGTLSYAFSVDDRASTLWSIMACAGAFLLTLAIFNLPDYAGLFQRLMFVLSFIWIWMFLSKA